MVWRKKEGLAESIQAIAEMPGAEMIVLSSILSQQ